jgi:hypothetical protein
MLETFILDSGGWGVFIAPTTKTVVGEGYCWWVHRTVRCASHVTQSLGFWRFRPLELWHLGAPDSPVLHRTGTVHCLVRLLALLWLCVNCARTVHVVSRPLKSTVVLATVALLGTPDSPVNYSGVRPQKPKGKEFSLYGPWGTGQSGAPDQGSLQFLCSFLLNPNLDLFIGLCWIFSTCRMYNLEQTS